MASSVRLRAWVIPVEIGLGLATIAIIPLTSVWRTTYSGASGAAAVADLSAGIGLMAAGTALIITNLRPAVGASAVLAGIAWLSADWAGWQGGPALPRTLAMGIGLYFLPLILHLLAMQQRDRAQRIAWLTVPAAYLGASAVAVGLLLFRDPRTDLHCWSNCTDDVLLIGNQPVIAGLVGAAAPALELATGGTIVLVSTWWILRSTITQRHLAAVIAIPAVLIGAGGASHGLALLADPHEGPRFVLHEALFQVRAWAAALLAAGLGWTIIRAARSRAAVLRLAADLGNAPAAGSVGPALASATGDASLEVLYWLPHMDAYVDGSGHRTELPPPDPRRTVTRLSRGGRQIGVVSHDPSIISRADLDLILGPAATLALDNERLRAELVAKVGEVRASRTRIVAAGDAARARLERDVHDGAQQGLLAVTYELRRASAAAQAAGDEVRTMIDAAVREAESMLAELRDIAHGIHPVILQDKGLGPALRSLADRAPILVEVRAAPDERLPRVVERTVYAVVASAIEAAAQAGAAELVIGADRSGTGLVLEIDGLDLDAPPEIADRVGAVDGTLAWKGRTLRLWIPCA